MPKWDFKCSKCGHIEEVEYSLHDEQPTVECPYGHGPCRKMFNPTPGHFKGGGWGKVYGVHKGKQIDG